MSNHWVCAKCWGPIHEEITIGRIVHGICAACGEEITPTGSHAVQDEEFARILMRLDPPAPEPSKP